MDSNTFLNVTIHHIEQKELAKKLLPIAKKYLADTTKLTNAWNYKNTYVEGPGLSTCKDLNFFVKYLLEISNKYFDDNSIKIKNNLELEVSLFVSEMVLGDEHSLHDHPGALLSGLIYLQVPNGSSNLEFYNPKSYNKAWTIGLDESSYVIDNSIFRVNNLQKIIIKPTAGLLLFWESWIKHCVPVNQSLDGRITMVFNIGIRDKK